MNTPAMMRAARMPPTTPPTMAPVEELLLDVAGATGMTGGGAEPDAGGGEAAAGGGDAGANAMPAVIAGAGMGASAAPSALMVCALVNLDVTPGSPAVETV